MNDIWLNIAMVFAFVLIGGVFSGAEIALVSLRESQVRAMSEGGQMTKDLALLVSRDQAWLNTQDFLAAIDGNLQKAMAS